MAAETRSGLLLDWGGVMTSNLMSSFSAFCEAEGLDPGALVGIFRANREARELLFAFEEGRIEETEFELGLAGLLGVAPCPQALSSATEAPATPNARNRRRLIRPSRTGVCMTPPLR